MIELSNELSLTEVNISLMQIVGLYSVGIFLLQTERYIHVIHYVNYFLLTPSW